MILGEIDTKQEVTAFGKYCDGLAVVLDYYYMNGDFGERQEYCADGSGAVQYGRRVLRWDSQGFVGSLRFDSADEASDYLDNAYSDGEDDV